MLIQPMAAPAFGLDVRRSHRRTARLVRRRFRLVERLVAVVGTLWAVILIGLHVVQLPEPSLVLNMGFLLPAGLFVALAALLPWLIVHLLWYIVRWWKQETWS